jgi:hypothetical protein
MAATEPIPEIDGSSIIMLGTFNAAIFQPQWFARHGLIPNEEAETVSNLVIAEGVARFNTRWLELLVVPGRFQAATADGSRTETLRDLVGGVFELLEHTPVKAMGINRMMHFKLDTEEAWHGVGDRLAPKDFWKPIFTNRPGLRRLDMQGQREGSSAETVHVITEPSARVTPYGLFIQVNEHFDINPDKDSVSVLVQQLRQHWEQSQRFALDVARQVLSLKGEATA